MGRTQQNAGNNEVGKAGRAAGHGTARLIRFLVALAGGDPRQCQVPPLRRALQVTVQRGDPAELRFIVVAPAGRVVTGNFVYVAGPVVAVAGNTVQVQGNAGGRPVAVTLTGDDVLPQPGQWFGGCGVIQGTDIVIARWESKDVQ